MSVRNLPNPTNRSYHKHDGAVLGAGLGDRRKAGRCVTEDGEGKCLPVIQLGEQGWRCLPSCSGQRGLDERHGFPGLSLASGLAGHGGQDMGAKGPVIGTVSSTQARNVVTLRQAVLPHIKRLAGLLVLIARPKERCG